jgi:hypothetical protein
MTHDFERRRPLACLSDRAIDGLLAGELAGAARTTAEAHLTGCEACSARVRDIEAARRAFPLEAPSFAALVSARPARPVRRWRWAWPSFAGLAAAAAALVLVLGPLRPGTPTEGTREKGADHLSLFVMHAGARRAGASGEIVHPGDRLQLAYTAAKGAHLAVLSRDARGRVDVLFPRGDVTAPVDAAKLAPLPYSLELDAEPGAVTVYGLFCVRAEALGPLRSAIEGDRQPSGCHDDRLTYEVRP